MTQVAAGDDFNLVVTSTGELFAFGDNEYGQLGFGANNGTNSPNPSPAEVQLPGSSGTVTAVAAGDDFSLVATSAGDLYSFGNNYYGQLGTTTNNGVNTANPSLEAVTLAGQSGSVTQLAAGSGFGLAVTSSGQLYSFGTNFSGQLGIATNDGTSDAANPMPALVTLPERAGPSRRLPQGGASAWWSRPAVSCTRLAMAARVSSGTRRSRVRTTRRRRWCHCLRGSRAPCRSQRATDRAL